MLFANYLKKVGYTCKYEIFYSDLHIRNKFLFAQKKERENKQANT